MLDPSDAEGCAVQIEEVATQLPSRGVLLLFPEGGNFTPARRRRALQKLWRRGRRREAHTGLGLAALPGEIWRRPPIGRTLKTHMWLVPAVERPTGPDAQIAWLYDWWKRLDGWLEEQGEEVAVD